MYASNIDDIQRAFPCSSIFRHGKLLDAVQSFHLYEDSKTFVDKPLKNDPEIVLDAFKKLGITDKSSVTLFLDKWFGQEGEEFEDWTPNDFVDRPSFLDKVRSVELRKFALDLNLKWKGLGRKIKSSVSEHPERHTLINVPHPFIVPGGRFREFYYWDSYWIVKGLLLCEMKETVKGMLKNFLHMVDRYGFIPNGGRVYYLNRSQPPLLIPMVWLYYENTGDLQFIKDNIPLLEKEYQFWRNNRMVTVQFNGTSHEMYHYAVPTSEPRPESYREDRELAKGLNDEQAAELYMDIASAAESGWDFSSRWFKLPTDGSFSLRQLRTSKKVPVDLNAFMSWNARLLSQMYKAIGNTRKQNEYNVNYEKSVNAIRSVLWDEEAGTWYDYDLEAGFLDKRFFVSTICPLFTQCHGRNNSEKLQTEKRFFEFIKKQDLTQYLGGIPTSMLATGQQWDYPNSWPPLQHMWVQALHQSQISEMKDYARVMAQKWVDMNLKVWLPKQDMFEKYDGVNGTSGRGGEYIVQTGFGWSNGVVLDFLSLYPDLEVDSTADSSTSYCAAMHSTLIACLAFIWLVLIAL